MTTPTPPADAWPDPAHPEREMPQEMLMGTLPDAPDVSGTLVDVEPIHPPAEPADLDTVATSAWAILGEVEDGMRRLDDAIRPLRAASDQSWATTQQIGAQIALYRMHRAEERVERVIAERDAARTDLFWLRDAVTRAIAGLERDDVGDEAIHELRRGLDGQEVGRG